MKKTMQQVINENYEKHRREYLEQQEEKATKRKETIFIIVAFIVIAIAFIGMDRYTDKAVQKCVDAGHSQSYCENGLN